MSCWCGKQVEGLWSTCPCPTFAGKCTKPQQTVWSQPVSMLCSVQTLYLVVEIFSWRQKQRRLFSNSNPAAILPNVARELLVPSSTHQFSGRYPGAPRTSPSEGISLCISCLPWKCSGLELDALGMWRRKLTQLLHLRETKRINWIKRQSEWKLRCLLIWLRHLLGEVVPVIYSCSVTCCCVSVWIEARIPRNSLFFLRTWCAPYWDERTLHLLLKGKVSALFEGLAQSASPAVSAPSLKHVQEYRLLWFSQGWGMKKTLSCSALPTVRCFWMFLKTQARRKLTGSKHPLLGWPGAQRLSTEIVSVSCKAQTRCFLQT